VTVLDVGRNWTKISLPAYLLRLLTDNHLVQQVVLVNFLYSSLFTVT